jgi:transcriptional regulator with XRE-family HTH domain
MGSFLLRQTGGRRGWQADLVARSGVKRQTISKWTNPAYDGWPELEHLAAVAAALGVRAWEVVAALEDDEPEVASDDRIRAIVREELAALPPRR